MSMHITASIKEQFGHIGEHHDLGYWEGDPPVIGDTIVIDGVTCEVLHRHWVEWQFVHLLVARTATETWMVGQ